MSVEIAEAYVRIRPDLADFPEELKAKLAAILDSVDGTVRVDADTGEVDAKMAQVEAEFDLFDTQDHQARMGVDTRSVVAGLAGSQALMDAWQAENPTARLGLADAEARQDILALRAELNAIAADPVTIPVDVDGVAAVAEVSAFQSLIDRTLSRSAVMKVGTTGSVRRDLTDITVALDAINNETLRPHVDDTALVKMKADADALLIKLLAVDAVADTAGRGGGGGSGAGGVGLLGMMGWGKGLWGLAGLGSVHGLAGFGAERFISTGLGLAGSAAGGLLGGGLLGAGALGKAGVGMGTDLAGIGQAAGDIKTTYTALAQYQTEQQALAMQLPHTAAAQAALNTALAGFAPAARPAVEQAALTANQFHWMFDKASGDAEATGAQIITGLMQVGEKFLPTIGRFAAENMGIIKTGLQPLETWIEGPGMVIFDELEGLFQERLPTAMHDFDLGVELIARTIGVAATYTGGFTYKLDGFLTRMNSTAGFDKWSGEIGKLIGDFRLWEHFIGLIGEDLADLFKAGAGTGNNIIATLSGMLERLHAWETSTSGQASLNNLFTAHEHQLTAILKLLPDVISIFGRLELAIAPALVDAVTGLVKGFDALIHIPFLGPIVAWSGAMLILGSRMNIIPMITGINKAWKTLMASDGVTATFTRSLFGLSAAEDAAGESAVGMDAAMDANPIGAIIVGVAALAAGLYELVDHWNTVVDFLEGPWGAAAEGAIAVVLPFIGIPLLIITHWRPILGVLTSIMAGVVNVFRDSFSWVLDAIEPLLGVFSHLPFIGHDFAAAESAVKSFQSTMNSSMTSAANSVRDFGTQAHADLTKTVGPIYTVSVKLGNSVVTGIQSGTDLGVPKVRTTVGQLPATIQSLLKAGTPGSVAAANALASLSVSGIVSLLAGGPGPVRTAANNIVVALTGAWTAGAPGSTAAAAKTALSNETAILTILGGGTGPIHAAAQKTIHQMTEAYNEEYGPGAHAAKTTAAGTTQSAITTLLGGAGAMKTATTSAFGGVIGAVNGQAGAARTAGQNVGSAFGQGLQSGISGYIYSIEHQLDVTGAIAASVASAERKAGVGVTPASMSAAAFAAAGAANGKPPASIEYHSSPTISVTVPPGPSAAATGQLVAAQVRSQLAEHDRNMIADLQAVFGAR